MLFLQKLFLILLSPLMIFFLLSIFAALLSMFKKEIFSKFVLALAFVSLLFFSSDFGQNVLVSPLENAINITDPLDHPSIKTVIVLGGGRYPESNRPTTAKLSPTSICRLVEGIRIFNLINANNLVCTGKDLYSDNSIAALMKQCAIDLKVKEAKIITIDSAVNTREEAKYCAEHFKGDSVFLVSSAAHLKRAVKNFEKEGIFVIPMPTDYQVHKKDNKKPIDYFPTYQNLVISSKSIHEYLGLFWEIFKELCLFWK